MMRTTTCVRGGCAQVPLPSPMRTNFINRSPVTSTFCESRGRSCFRHNLSISDIQHRDVSFTALLYRPDTLFNGAAQPGGMHAIKAKHTEAMLTLAQSGSAAEAAKVTQLDGDDQSSRSYGDGVLEKSAYWRPKHYGNVTFGPRNYPYPISRWLGRRFQMKKHKILKRMRFRRYKLASVANLPFAKMIRVGMLPELKSSKAKPADDIDAGLGAQLVSAAKNASGGKSAGRRTRPKSKYQV